MDEKGGKVMNQTRLIKRAKAGDAEVFEQLLLAYSEQMYRTAFLYAGNRDDALDVVQETSYKTFFATIKSLRINKYFATWLMRILINNSDECLKMKKRVDPLEYIEHSLSQRDDVKIEHMDLLQAIERLRKSYREAILLFYFHDLPIKDIAAVMEIPENTVKTYLRRGKEQLKNHLERGGHDGREIISGNI